MVVRSAGYKHLNPLWQMQLLRSNRGAVSGACMIRADSIGPLAVVGVGIELSFALSEPSRLLPLGLLRLDENVHDRDRDRSGERY